MPNKKKKPTIKLPKKKYEDLSKVELPKRPAIEFMLENLHNKGKDQKSN